MSFELNYTADWTLKEYNDHRGLKDKLAEQSNGPATELSLYDDEQDGGRLLDDEMDYYIDWVKEGKVTEVKNQGNSGSCWAFAAATTQESMQSIKHGDAPVRLSEQQGVDCCEDSYGCRGGWMRHFWEQSARAGSLTNQDYPYEARTRKCKEMPDKPIASKAIDSSIGRITNSVTEMKQQLQNGPMTIAVGASGKCWRYYKSGVLSAKNKCPTRLNHGVVVVGLYKGEADPNETE